MISWSWMWLWWDMNSWAKNSMVRSLWGRYNAPDMWPWTMNGQVFICRSLFVFWEKRIWKNFPRVLRSPEILRVLRVLRHRPARSFSKSCRCFCWFFSVKSSLQPTLKTKKNGTEWNIATVGGFLFSGRFQVPGKIGRGWHPRPLKKIGWYDTFPKQKSKTTPSTHKSFNSRFHPSDITSKFIPPI